MGGRRPIKVYTYTLKGKYLNTYESVQEYRKIYYPEDVSKRPCFVKKVKNIPYEISGDKISFQERPGKDMIRFIVAVDSSEYCKGSDETDNRVIEVYNHLGVKMAEFRNQRLLTKMMPHISQGTLSRQLNSSKKVSLKVIGLYFKYKE